MKDDKVFGTETARILKEIKVKQYNDKEIPANVSGTNVSAYEKMVEQYLYRGRKYEVVLTKTQLPGIEIWRKDASGVWDLWACLYYKEDRRIWKYLQYEDTPIVQMLENPLDANKTIGKKLLTANMIQILEAYTVAYKLNRQNAKGHNQVEVQGIIFKPPLLKHEILDAIGANRTISFKGEIVQKEISYESNS